MKGIEPQYTTFFRELICDADFLKIVPNIVDWCTPIDRLCNDKVEMRCTIWCIDDND